MDKTPFPKLARRVFAVRAAWRQQVPLQVRVDAVRSAAGGGEGEVPVGNGGVSGPPVKRVEIADSGSRVA